MSVNKVVVIGLDGVDWRSLRPLIDAGYLPTLGRLVRQGASGNLQSTVRPESSVAWSTFSTGVNPGKHGIFGFVGHQPNSYDFHLTNSSNIQAPCFWDYLGMAGYQVGLVNVPFTYPPQPLNGFLIGGMLTPGSHVNFTYPPTLQRHLMERLPTPYLFEIEDDTQDKQDLPQCVEDYTQQQLSTALLLLQEEAWDCFVIVFTGPDRLQHYFWTDFNRDELSISSEDPLLSHFLQLDQAVAQILDCLPDDTLILLLSDHGFNGVNRRFFINQWLQDKGYLKLHGHFHSTDSLLSQVSKLKRFSLVRQLKRVFLRDMFQLQGINIARAIDWSATRVYYAPDGGLRINLFGREPAGIVASADYESLCAELMAELYQVVDPQTAHSPIAQIYPREQLYAGPFMLHAPDLIVEPQRDKPDPQNNYLLDSKLSRQTTLFASARPFTGNHARQGILIASGGAVAGQCLQKTCRLQDIAPTLLAVMGVPIPNTMDGRPLIEIFEPNQQPELSFSSDTDTFQQTVQKKPSTKLDRIIAERLRNLGYLD